MADAWSPPQEPAAPIGAPPGALVLHGLLVGSPASFLFAGLGLAAAQEGAETRLGATLIVTLLGLPTVTIAILLAAALVGVRLERRHPRVGLARAILLVSSAVSLEVVLPGALAIVLAEPARMAGQPLATAALLVGVAAGGAAATASLGLWVGSAAERTGSADGLVLGAATTLLIGAALAAVPIAIVAVAALA